MKLRCYSIYDRKTLAFFPPFFMATDGAATRSFADLAGDMNTQVGKHPGDFVLFMIGEFDDQKGAMIPLSPIAHVIDASALVQAMQQEIPFPDHVAGKGNGEART